MLQSSKSFTSPVFTIEFTVFVVAGVNHWCEMSHWMWVCIYNIHITDSRTLGNLQTKVKLSFVEWFIHNGILEEFGSECVVQRVILLIGVRQHKILHQSQLEIKRTAGHSRFTRKRAVQPASVSVRVAYIYCTMSQHVNHVVNWFFRWSAFLPIG